MRLVRSSEVGAVERDQAIGLLTDRAILTRMVCRELAEGDIDILDRRPQAALFLLLRWIAENQSEHVRGEPRADNGLEHMAVPEGYEKIVPELESGAKLCNALFMLYTADNQIQVEHDISVIRTCVADYRKQHPQPVPMPRVILKNRR